ncbi:MAG: hypothetical protein ABIP12_02085 [Terriglobales bacterium]
MSQLSTVRLLALLLAALFACAGCGAFTRPSDIVVADPAAAIADAQKMIAEKKGNPDKYRDNIPPADLPKSLQIPGLFYAQVYDDHMNLIVARQPDWKIGARIWATGSTRAHSDRPTKYPGIMFFRYTHDAPDAPENLP